MEIRTLKYFVTIVNEKTMTSAAETLHLSQSALSKQIQLLEDELGKKLFHRDKNRLCLTDAGKFLYQRSEKILEIADTTKNYIMMYDEAALDDISLCIGEAKKLELISKTIEQTKGYKVQISFINLQKTADIAINERTYIYDRCTLQLPPGRNPLR